MCRSISIVFGLCLSVSALVSPPAPATAAALCGGLEPDIVGTVGNDVLIGTPLDDVIAGRGGDDDIRGLGGNDTLCGGLGDDLLRGQGGKDILIGGNGDDTLRGGGDTDLLFGGAGDDRLFGQGRHDSIWGGSGSDRTWGGGGVDTCVQTRRVSGCELPPRPFLSLAPPPPLPGSATASGSGCLAGSAPLADGYWFGYVTESSGSDITFDLACFFFGNAATVAATADGIVLDDPYYVRNQSSLLRTVGLSPSTSVFTLDFSKLPDNLVRLTFAQWPAQSGGYTPCPGEFCGVWLTINRGSVNGMVEQYVP